jgi:folylpolyglutamate synthase/dihydropteroate synthase
MARALDLAGTEGGVVVTGSITLVAEVVERSA